MTNGSILLSGITKSGKSTLAAEAVLDIYNKTGLKGRVIYCDGGGTERAFSFLKKKGIVELYDILALRQGKFGIFELFEKAALGWAPDAQGRWTPRSKVDLAKEYGVWVFEGLTALGDSMMIELQDLVADKKAVGKYEDAVDIASYDTAEIDSKGKAVEFKIAASTRGHYNTAQTWLKRLVNASTGLPGLTIWTCHEKVGETAGDMVFGPSVPGGAATAKVPSWFEDYLTIEIKTKKVINAATKLPEEVVERRLHLKPWYDTRMQNVIHMSCTRVSKEGAHLVPEWIEPSWKGFVEVIEKAEAAAEAAKEGQLTKKEG